MERSVTIGIDSSKPTPTTNVPPHHEEYAAISIWRLRAPLDKFEVSILDMKRREYCALFQGGIVTTLNEIFPVKTPRSSREDPTSTQCRSLSKTVGECSNTSAVETHHPQSAMWQLSNPHHLQKLGKILAPQVTRDLCPVQVIGEKSLQTVRVNDVMSHIVTGGAMSKSKAPPAPNRLYTPKTSRKQT